MGRGIETLSKIVIISVVAGVLPLAMAGTAAAAQPVHVKAIGVNDASALEGDPASPKVRFTISWTGAKGGGGPTVAYATANGSATAGQDYTARSGTASLAQNGCRCATVDVPVLDDTMREGTETFTLNLSSPSSGASIADAQGLGTIYDNEGPPALVVADASATEALGPVSITVSLTHATTSTVTVNYATANGTATAGSDYTAKPSTTLTFNPGQVSKTVPVSVIDDALSEGDETFKLNLTNASNASIADAQGIGTIVDDDPEPDISVGDVSVVEGDTGTVTASFPVTLSAASGLEVDVDYATANGTATAGSDYETKDGTLVFAAGDTTKQIDVTVDADVAYEGNETFTVDLSAPLNANILAGTGHGTITDDDAGPKLSVANATILEGNSGTSALVFSVSMVPSSGSVVTVDYATANGTATAGSDYTAGSGTLTFNPGIVTRTATVNVTGDTIDEPDETLTLTISNPTGGGSKIIDADGVGTITDNDPAPSLSIGDVTVPEGDSGTVTASFPVTLSAASGRQVDVDYTTVDGTGTAGSDYETATGTLVFAAGETTKQIDVTVDPDVVAEINKTFTVVLSSPQNASILGGTGLGTITDDDAVPKISIGDATVLEGNSGATASLGFTVSMDPISASVVTVDYAITDGTATAGSDYTSLPSGTLTFAPGELTKTVTVDVTGDTTYESDETLTLNLSNPGGGLSKVIDAQGVGTITNDDKAPTALTMKLAKGKTTIQAKGLIEKADSGMKVKVTLYKKKGAKYVRVASKTVAIGSLADRDLDGLTDGTYAAKFTRPGRGAYQFKAVYAGSATLLSCLRSLKFKL
jgi:subtilisin-like proprotein convertase family protein